MPRRRNPRRLMLESLRRLKKNAQHLGFQLNVTGRVYLEPHEREEPSQWFRERREDEYPENDMERLKVIVDFADALIVDAHSIRDEAIARYWELREQQKGAQSDAR